MATRWRWPPDSSAGLAVERRRRQGDEVEELGGLPATLAAGAEPERPQRVGDDLGDGEAGFSDA